ncbi:hypothetical protein XA68_16958 [Ophiocordyceps unilateralis]|uniref:Cut9 interacting protein Scn1 n=1 Tax=Ophiocordyceps unilateralis TaxID=268505 RepID=A0A2A9P5M4_OPHUN|nr:hypothetical protein XA68_16958 [Ophiocordyceps unilateralis]
MCRPSSSAFDGSQQHDDEDQENQLPFPWHLDVFDAHCHPTETMASLADALPSMRATALVIMATRSQDQHLVFEAAAAAAAVSEKSCRLIPSFGWHPWFSHQLYDDGDAGPHATFRPPPLPDDGDALHQAKKAHYHAVLFPTPEDDFVRALPTPTPLSSCIAATRARLCEIPHALVGEAGLDKAFRVPRPWGPPAASSRDTGLTPGGREGRLLSPYRVRMPHQQAVLTQQLRLAAAEGRPVSLHGVQAHGTLYDTVSACWKGFERRVPSRRERRHNQAEAPASSSENDSKGEGEGESAPKPYPPRICLHSFSGSVELLSQWMQPSIPADIFVSFSAAINLGAGDSTVARAKLDPVVRAVPDDRILVESDLHQAGPSMDDALERMYRTVCAVKGWPLDDGVRRIGRNFRRFVFGGLSRDDQKR